MAATIHFRIIFLQCLPCRCIAKAGSSDSTPLAVKRDFTFLPPYCCSSRVAYGRITFSKIFLIRAARLEQLLRGGGHREQGDLITLLLCFQNRECMLKVSFSPYTNHLQMNENSPCTSKGQNSFVINYRHPFESC
jgi:hypothetical protein